MSGWPWRSGDRWREPVRMDEGFPGLPRAWVTRGGGGRWGEGARTERDLQQLVGEGAAPLSQRRALSAVDPPRPISNRVVKHRSAEGTGSSGAGRQGPRAHQIRPPPSTARRRFCVSIF